jgi:hypothetical protein
MLSLRAALVAALGLSVPAIATAQPKPKPAPPADAGGTEVELAEDPPPDDIEGRDENPDAPRLPGDDRRVDDAPAPAPKRTGYPIEEVLRPITLPAVTSEVSVDAGATFDGLDAAFGVRARYGVTRQWQVGLRYLIGGVFDDPTTPASDSIGFATGKALGLDVSYLVFDWMAARVTFPVYVDPFAVGLTFGAPMKFRIGDRLAVVAVDDFLDVRLKEFIPSLRDERLNVGWASDAIATRTIRPDANLHFRVGAIYQIAPDLAVRGNIGVSFLDMSDDDAPTHLEGLIQYSPMPQLDVIGRAGWTALDQPTETFGLMVAAAYRI